MLAKRFYSIDLLPLEASGEGDKRRLIALTDYIYFNSYLDALMISRLVCDTALVVLGRTTDLLFFTGLGLLVVSIAMLRTF